MLESPVDLAPNQENFLQNATQDTKILFILLMHDKIRHSSIFKLNFLYPGIQRKSSRTYYKIYEKLISNGQIKKIKDPASNQQYYAYKLTPQGKNYVKFLLNRSEMKNPPSFQEFQEIQKQESKKMEVPTDLENSDRDGVLTRYLISEIKELKTKLHRYENLTQDTLKSYLSHNNDGSKDRLSSNSLDNPLTPRDEKLDKNSNKDAIDENFTTSDESSLLLEDLLSPSTTLDEFDTDDNSTPEEEPLSEEELHQLYIQKMDNREYFEYFLTLPPSLLRSSETWNEFWSEIARRSLSPEEKRSILQEFIRKFEHMRTSQEIQTLVAKFGIDEVELGKIHSYFTKNNESIEFLDPILDAIIHIIYQKIHDNTLQLDDLYHFSGYNFKITQFIHFPINYYYDHMKLGYSLKYIQYLKTNLVKNTEFSFKYEIKIYLDLKQYSEVKSLIYEELVSKERQIDSKELWYLIFRVYYETKDLTSFLNLPTIDFDWRKIAEFEQSNLDDIESIPSLSKFKDVYAKVCPFFQNEIKGIYELVSLFIKEIEKGRNTTKRDEWANFTHLYVPYFARWLHQVHRNTGSDEDFGLNLLYSCLNFSDLYKGFLTVYEEILEKYTEWNGPVEEIQNALNQIAQIRESQTNSITNVL